MDIKLAQFHRIRLNSKDLNELKTNRRICANFDVTPKLRFEVVINLEEDQSSRLIVGDHQVNVSLSLEDLNRISSGSLMKDGLTFGRFCLQVDAWSEKKRNRKEVSHAN